MSKKKSEMLPADQFLDVTVYLQRCSLAELHQFELSRLGDLAHIRKQLGSIFERMVTVKAEALCARVMIENRNFASSPLRAGLAAELLAELVPGQESAPGASLRKSSSLAALHTSLQKAPEAGK